jgi:hypothetical protein
VVLTASGGAAAIALARKKPDSDQAAAEALQAGAVEACGDYMNAQGRIAGLNKEAADLQGQLNDLKTLASQRHDYIQNVARPALIAERNAQLRQLAAAIALSSPTFAPGEVAVAVGFATGGWGFLLPLGFGLVFAVVAAVDTANLITMDQIDQAIAQSHATVDAEYAKNSQPLQNRLDKIPSDRAAADAASAAAAQRVSMFESAMRAHDPPISFTPCGGSSSQ